MQTRHITGSQTHIDETQQNIGLWCYWCRQPMELNCDGICMLTVFRTDPNTTTARSIFISSPAVRSGALVRVANNVFGPGGPSVYSTTDYCSLYVPRNAQAIVSVYTFFTTSLSPECQQRLELTQWNSSSTFQLCRYQYTGMHQLHTINTHR